MTRARALRVIQECAVDLFALGVEQEGLQTRFSQVLPQNATVKSDMRIGMPVSGGVEWPKQLRIAQAHGYKSVLGCAYPHDPMHPPVWYMRWLVGKNLVPGAIVILHDGTSDP